MNKKKTIIVSIIILLILGIIAFGYYFITKEDKDTTLTLIEKQWIESNKNNVIDMSIINDIPVLSYNGEGLIIEFLNSLNEKTNLSFNKVSYNLNDDVKSSYAFKISSNVEDKDILIYTDNYVIVGKEKIYKSLNELTNITIGVLNDELSNVNNYLNGSDVVYKTYSDKNTMLKDLDDDSIDAAILLKTTNMEDIIKNNYTILYNISDYKKYFILSLGDEEKLNNILIKYYSKWKSENYDKVINNYLSKNYFKFKEITDSEIVKFRSKRYNYGFIENAPYDTVKENKLAGINNALLQGFSSVSSAEISYKKYNNIEEMINAFNRNEIDFFYGINKDFKYEIDVFQQVPLYNNTFVILKHTTNDTLVKSIKSLSNVVIIKNSKVEEYLSKNNVSYKTYDNLKELVSSIKDNDIIIIDLNSYNYYKEKLSKYIICNEFHIENFSFISRDINDNKVFNEFLSFYSTYIDTDLFVTQGLNELINVNKATMFLKYVAIVLGIIVALLLMVLAIIKLKPKKKKNNLTKEDKLRYIDSLTSLRNRNYLNDSVSKWDQSGIYPQAIIIIDLNNIAYINDNYGHEEGDLVISEAANALILNQLENTEIIRTNGNEFLIYLVGYDEKQVQTYIRKLNKSLKDIKHNFGAALGYSMIYDAIKTVDDAINEATIDMKNKKEEVNKEKND